jgi:hypothetical protein
MINPDCTAGGKTAVSYPPLRQHRKLVPSRRQRTWVIGVVVAAAITAVGYIALTPDHQASSHRGGGAVVMLKQQLAGE